MLPTNVLFYHFSRVSSFIINDAGQEQLVAGKTKKQKTITDKIDFIYLFSGKFPMKKYKKKLFVWGNYFPDSAFAKYTKIYFPAHK